MNEYLKSQGCNLVGFERSMWSFEVTYEGEVHTYLGCEIHRELEAGKTLLSQKHYAEDVLRTYDYWDCILALTPRTPGSCLTKEQCNPRPDPAFHH